ncbi:DUF3016 domain-containing protein [Lysobacter sp. GX 14042]|uniref:DUF3016 domain-containing protein n=1 Tax=Lysobacter sp. GX 14042 TaxID=2907155 RepID=UPI001F3EE792|nr:DUF3016 domain-containing protein [Lysobacter sp. GX 14042]MCE7031144.1 DUF3016 domain-containing protein [Lysobacter sp. GX 14042]
MRLHLLAAAAAVALAACATTPVASSGPGQLQAGGPVSVSWSDPAGFSEITRGRDRIDTLRGTWVRDLAAHLRDSAAGRLGPGEQLEVELLDVDRAGDYEPWRGPNADDIRILRDIYPPRITLRFRHLGAQGQVLAEGERRLSDSGFMSRTPAFRNNDPLRYEKQLLDDWLGRELGRR